MKFKTLCLTSTILFSYLSIAQADLIFKNGMEFEPRLNDTGITWAGEYSSGNNIDCTSSTISSSQDCHQGRDATHNDDSDGNAGFSFTKLDVNGTPLADQSVDYAATPWACVQDNVTGLVWEVKTTDGGLHDKNDRYNWYNTNSATNGGADGDVDDDGAICSGYNSSNSSSFCNTQAFTARVNTQSLCGQTDWRVPDINELHSIAHHGKVNLSIDENYFPNTASSIFWASSPYASDSRFVWIFGFSSGVASFSNHRAEFHVRLVRGGQWF